MGKSPTGFRRPVLPAGWVRICRWRIDDNLYLGDSTVSFYAVRPGDVPELRVALQSYAPSLPPTVTVVQN